MRTRSITVLCFLVAVAACTAIEAQDTAAGWKAAAASVVVTPEQSMWMAGYGSRNKLARAGLL